MKEIVERSSLKNVEIAKYSHAACRSSSDQVSVEEPLEIRLSSTDPDDYKQIAVTMRTPGNDRELAAGFLFTEGIVSEKEDIESIHVDKCNFVNVKLRHGVAVDETAYARHSFVASSCGVCGKKTIAAVQVKRKYFCVSGIPLLSADVVHRLP